MPLPGSFSFTSPETVLQAVAELQNLLQTGRPLPGIRQWLQKNQHLAKAAPFGEIQTLLQKLSLTATLPSTDEESLSWLLGSLKCSALDLEDLQFLSKILGRVSTETVLNPFDMGQLRDWLNARNYLRGVWPYQELLEALSSLKYVDKISTSALEGLKNHVQSFFRAQENKLWDLPLKSDSTPLSRLCSLRGRGHFAGKKVLLASASAKSGQELKSRLQNERALVIETMAPDTEYLVLASDVSPAWRQSSYGRWVAQALEQQKSGASLQILMEAQLEDLFDKAS